MMMEIMMMEIMMMMMMEMIEEMVVVIMVASVHRVECVCHSGWSKGSRRLFARHFHYPIYA
jgi:hypothetical protein